MLYDYVIYDTYSHTPCSIFVSTSRVAGTDAGTAIYRFAI